MRGNRTHGKGLPRDPRAQGGRARGRPCTGEKQGEPLRRTGAPSSVLNERATVVRLQTTSRTKELGSRAGFCGCCSNPLWCTHLHTQYSHSKNVNIEYAGEYTKEGRCNIHKTHPVAPTPLSCLLFAPVPLQHVHSERMMVHRSVWGVHLASYFNVQFMGRGV